MRYKLIIAYDGTAFHGWQLQPGRRTVQSEIEAAVARLTGESVRVMASGRTDAGVHANGQVVAFNLQREWEARRLHLGLNAHTPGDLAIRATQAVEDRFDPRRWARRRRYVYRIWNTNYESPFWRRYAWRLAYRFDVEAMQRAAQHLLGRHDFTSLRAAGCDAETPIRQVFRSEVARDGELITYTVEATAFLRHMVRNIIGTLVEVGRGVREADSLPLLLAACDRTLAGGTAPPRGLCLEEVSYGENDSGDRAVAPQPD